MSASDQGGLFPLVFNLLREASSVLQERRVIPPSSYNRFLQVGNDFEGNLIMFTESYKTLDRYLKESFNSHFKDAVHPKYWEITSLYLFRCISRAISITDWDEGEDLFSERVASEVAEGLTRTLTAGVVSLNRCRSVSHIATEGGTTLTIKSLEVRPVMDDGDLNGPKQWAREGIYGAFNNWRDDHLVPMGRPLSLITQSMEGEWDLVDSFYGDPDSEIDDFILACRLVYNATVRNYWELIGSPDPFAPFPPSLSEFRDFDGFISIIQKDALIKVDQIAGIVSLIERIQTVTRKPYSQMATPIEIGLANFTKSFSSGKSIRSIADLATCLESIMLTGERTEIGLKLKSRTAALISSDSDSLLQLYEDIKNLYDLRSVLIHGGAVDEPRLRKVLLKIVSREDVRTTELLALAVDRFQDIVRRALMARLILDSHEESPWNSVNEKRIDALLADVTYRDTCKSIYLNALREMNLGFVAERSNPARVTFVDPDN